MLALRLVPGRNLVMRAAVRTAVVTAEGGSGGGLRVDRFGVEKRRGTPVGVDRRLD